jgi:hypothetical protein
MSELPPSNPNRGAPEYERTLEDAKRYEAREIAALNKILWDLFENRLQLSDIKEHTNVSVEADAALDNVARLAESLGQRDPELALALIEELESGPHSGTDQTISEQLRVMLGLPPWDHGVIPPTEHEQ